MKIYIIAKLGLSIEQVAKELVENYAFDGADSSFSPYLSINEAEARLELIEKDPQNSTYPYIPGSKYKIYELSLSLKD